MTNYIIGPNFTAHDVTEEDRAWLSEWLTPPEVANTFHYATNELPGVYKDLAWIYCSRRTGERMHVAISKIANQTVTTVSTSTHPSFRGSRLGASMFPEILAWWKMEGSSIFGINSITIVSHPPYKRARESSPEYPWVTVYEDGYVWHERLYLSDL